MYTCWFFHVYNYRTEAEAKVFVLASVPFTHDPADSLRFKCRVGDKMSVEVICTYSCLDCLISFVLNFSGLPNRPNALGLRQCVDEYWFLNWV